MNRIFFRFFLLVMLSITLATFLVYVSISWLFGDPLEENAARQASPQIFLLEHYIDQAPVDEWLTRLNKVREVSHVKFDLISLEQALSKLPATRRIELQNGAIVIDAQSKAFFRRVDLRGDRYVGSEDDVLYARDLPIDTLLALKTEALRFVIIIFVLLVPIAFWSRAHWRELQNLSAAANAFGEGNLSTRAKVKKSASLYPLAKQINHMATRIQTLIGTQKHLLHSVSHELRTPIARLEFGMELLRQAVPDQTAELRIDAMQKDLDELNTLITELLDMAKLEQHSPQQFSPFDMIQNTQNCIRSLHQELLPYNVITTISHDACTYIGDQRLLARALNNLLLNATKYAVKDISVTLHQTLDQTIEILVEDDGAGVPDTEQERIFEPFYRLDRSRDRSTGGFGLGLAIARQAVQRHGGSLTVKQSRLGGACFMIRLPQQPLSIES
jgi:two-component system OmpR family sensor kinase